MARVTLRLFLTLGALAATAPATTAIAQEGARPAAGTDDEEAAIVPGRDEARDGEAERDEEEARSLFMEARAAFDAARFADARRLLERSLSLSPRPATAINLARVLRSLGEMRAAIDVLGRLRGGEYGEVDAERSAEASTLLDEARRELGRIVVAALGESRGVTVRLDGVQVAELAGASLTYEQEVDPGDHVVVGVTEDGRTDEVSFAVAPGADVQVLLEFPAPAVDLERAGRGGTAAGWVWGLLIGGAVALVAAAVVIGVVVASSGAGGDPVEDPQGVFPVVEALSWGGP